MTDRPKPRQSQVLALFANDPMGYVTRGRLLASEPGMPKHVPDQTLIKMRDNGTLYALVLPTGTRYFLTQEARAAGEADFPAERAAMVAARQERRREYDRKRDAERVAPGWHKARQAKASSVAKAAKAAEPKKVPLRHAGSSARPIPKPIVRGKIDAYYPPGLVVQQGPNYIGDTRYMVTGPVVGGFVSEWRTLRGAAGALERMADNARELGLSYE